MNVHMQSPYL